MYRIRASVVILAWLVCIVAAGLPSVGTAQNPVRSHVADWRESSIAYMALADLASSESPSDTPVSVPELPGFARETGGLPTGIRSARDVDANLDLRNALEHLAADAPESGAPVDVAPTEFARLEAVRLYAGGMALRTSGDNEGAAREFTRALRLDPNAAQIWVRLAESQARIGRGPDSLLSRRRAADLGDNNPVSLYILGSHMARTGEPRLAAHYLARCLQHNPERIDPLLGTAARFRIAFPLAQTGFIRASMQAMREARDDPPVSRSPFAADLLAFREVEAQLGEFIAGLDFVVGNDGIVSLDRERTGRPLMAFEGRVRTMLGQGRKAGAAVVALDRLTETEGVADRRLLSLLEYLGTDATLGPLLLVAIGEFADDRAEAPRSVAESLHLALAAAAGGDDAAEILEGRAKSVSGERRVLDALMGATSDDQARVDRALRLIDADSRSAPEAAAALWRWHNRPTDLFGALPNSDAGVLLRAHLLALAGRWAEAASIEISADQPVLVRVVGEAAALAGRWDVVDRAIDMLADHPTDLAHVLSSAQRSDDTVMQSIALETSPGALLVGAELALMVGDIDAASAMLERAVALDPYDARGYEGLVNIHQARSDPGAASETIERLRTRRPDAQILRWSEAQSASLMVDPYKAESIARLLLEESPDKPMVVDLLADCWAKYAGSGEISRIASARAWLDEQRLAAPFGDALTIAHARLLAIEGLPDDAERALRDARASRPSPVVDSALETFYRQVGSVDDARRVASERYGAAGYGIDASLDYAESLARDGMAREMLPVLVDAMPEGATLAPRQRARLSGLVGVTIGAMQSRPAPEQRNLQLDVLDRALGMGVPMEWRVLWARWAIMVDERSVSDPEIVVASRVFLDSLPTIEATRPILDGAGMVDPAPVRTLDEARGSVAYLLGNSLYSSDREDAAFEVLRMAVELHPGHAWAANDLGYFLVERGRSLDEAERLLERAYALRPGQASIADSLGWLRYKMGQFEDESDGEGEIRLGAISLLTKATELPGGADNTTIVDHLGDALWRAGEHERALATWTRAYEILVDRLVQLDDGGISPTRDALQEEMARVGAKPDAVRAGAEPRVAPILDRTDPDGVGAP